MSQNSASTLAGALPQIPDPRNRRGQSHAWLCTLVVIAALCLGTLAFTL
jgi:hypothetical protein